MGLTDCLRVDTLLGLFVGDLVEVDGNMVGVNVGILREGSIDGTNEGDTVGALIGGCKGIVKGPLKKLPGSYLPFTVISLSIFAPK